jgi:accessory gene regulator B
MVFINFVLKVGMEVNVRFVQKWSYSCAKYLSHMLEEDHQKRAVYYYGFQIAIGSVVKIISLIAISIVFGVLIPALIISISFTLLRKVAGGFHMKTYGKCLVVTIGLFIAAASIAQYTHQFWSVRGIVILITLTFITGIYLLIKYAPKDNPNKVIVDLKERRCFKVLSIIYMIIWLVLVFVLTMYGMKMYTLALCFSVMLELFGITPIGYSFFEKIEHRLALEQKTN